MLDEETIAQFLTDHPDWTREGNAIVRMFVMRDFVVSMGLVNSIALLAERADHHPDLDIRWNKVRVLLTTHEAGGLTEKDTSLAAEIDALPVTE